MSVSSVNVISASSDIKKYQGTKKHPGFTVKKLLIMYLAKGIWSHMPTKLSIILWRIKWGFLTIFVNLRSWGIQTEKELPPLQLFWRDHQSHDIQLHLHQSYSSQLLRHLTILFGNVTETREYPYPFLDPAWYKTRERHWGLPKTHPPLLLLGSASKCSWLFSLVHLVWKKQKAKTIHIEAIWCACYLITKSHSYKVSIGLPISLYLL